MNRDCCAGCCLRAIVRVPMPIASGRTDPARLITARRQRHKLTTVPSHPVREDWMGAEVETLEDLLRPHLDAVCVGINPSPVSVAAGHYYQGEAGKRFVHRLRGVGLIPKSGVGHEDDAAFASGIGFTDIIKRATATASELSAEEYAHGRQQLVASSKISDPSSSSSPSRRPPRWGSASSRQRVGSRPADWSKRDPRHARAVRGGKRGGRHARLAPRALNPASA